MEYTYTNQKDLRQAFRQQFPELNFRRCVKFGDQKTFVTDTRCTWADWIENLVRDGQISEKLADRATL